MFSDLIGAAYKMQLIVVIGNIRQDGYLITIFGQCAILSCTPCKHGVRHEFFYGVKYPRQLVECPFVFLSVFDAECCSLRCWYGAEAANRFELFQHAVYAALRCELSNAIEIVVVYYPVKVRAIDA